MAGELITEERDLAIIEAIARHAPGCPKPLGTKITGAHHLKNFERFEMLHPNKPTIQAQHISDLLPIASINYYRTFGLWLRM